MKTYQKLLLIFVAFILLRLTFILTFPPFTDESLYVRWGQLMVYKPDLMWASIAYFKRQPLGFWIFGVGALLFNNPLLGGRFMVLLFNLPTVFVTYFITKRFTSQKAALLAAFILAICPLFILIQSLILMDGLLMAVSAVIMWFLLQDWKQKQYLYVAAIGILLGLALWIKTTALFFVLLSVIGLFVKAKQERIKPVTTAILLGILIGIPMILLTPLFLRPDITMILKEPGYFAMSPAEIIKNPFGLWLKNIFVTIYSLTLYLNPLILITIISGRTLYSKKNILLLIWLALPIGITILVAKNFQIRYFTFAFMAVIPYCAYGAEKIFLRIKHTALLYIFLVILTLYSMFFIFHPIQFFSLFPAYSGERDYALSWPSGYGIPELVNWIDTNMPENGRLTLALADSPGNPSDYLSAYYFFSPNVKTGFVTINNIHEFQKLRSIADANPLYLATRSTLIPEEIQPFLIPVKLFKKPDSSETVGIYRVTFTKTNVPL